MNLLSALHQQFIIPVIRGASARELESICSALLATGLRILEITLMSDEAFTIIKKLAVNTDLLIGAGTVLTADQASKAIDAGAKFLIAPGLNAHALKIAQRKNIPFFPGVLTPTEIMQANALGAEMVKLFPISAVGGMNYIKLLQGPFPDLKWLASGGITLPSLKNYIESGATCVGLGHELLPPDKIKAKDWQGISELATSYLHEVALLRKVN